MARKMASKITVKVSEKTFRKLRAGRNISEQVRAALERLKEIGPEELKRMTEGAVGKEKITVKLPEEEYAMLKSLSEETGMTVSAIVRALLNKKEESTGRKEVKARHKRGKEEIYEEIIEKLNELKQLEAIEKRKKEGRPVFVIEEKKQPSLEDYKAVENSLKKWEESLSKKKRLSRREEQVLEMLRDPEKRAELVRRNIKARLRGRSGKKIVY
ncbi:hypothetical protein DRN74_00380 [Candidatus Micrarchaeota archaeon]|nr:MAG: hypothetical protein DRN74_00380 [Candidatus Micrarchaeota archaeon]